MAKLTEAQAQLFRDPNFGVVGTVKADGSPQTSVVWLDYDGENVLFNTTRPRAKGRHLTRDPRVSVSVIDRDDPYRYVEVEGTAELVDEGANEHIHKLSWKYNDREYPDPTGRVIVRVRPERVHAMNVD